jgi:hypothetical protein
MGFNMIKLITILFGIFISTQAWASDFPENFKAEIEKYFSGYTSPKGTLDKDYVEYFKLKGKNLRPWSIVGDFNADKKDDWAGLISSSSKKLSLVALISNEKGFVPYVIKKDLDEDNNDIYITLDLYVKPEIETRFGEPGDPPKHKLTGAGIDLTYLEKSALAIYLKDNKWIDVWYAD